MTKPYRVHIGYTPKGNDRWRYFASREDASALLNEVFQRSGIVLTLVKTPDHDMDNGENNEG